MSLVNIKRKKVYLEENNKYLTMKISFIVFSLIQRIIIIFLQKATCFFCIVNVILGIEVKV